MADKTLSDKETRLTRWSKLSDVAKKRARADWAAEKAAAEADEAQPLGRRVLNTLSELNPVTPERIKREHREIESEDVSRRKDRAARARNQAAKSDEDLDKEKMLYSDEKVHSLTDAEMASPAFKRGGVIKAKPRGCGCATKGFGKAGRK